MAPRFVSLSLAIGLALIAALVSGRDASQRAAADGGFASPPALLLPWEDGQTWLTGISGFHGANDALDFFPPDTPLSMDVVCEGEPGWYEAISSYWVLASAAGTVVYADRPLVIIDHGEGWRTGYYHMDDIQVDIGEHVDAGQRLARPSMYGVCTTGPHVHFWALGPDGATTADVSLSGVRTDEIGINAYISETANASGSGVTPQPSPAMLPGDADCDGDADSVDALAVLRESAGLSHSATCMAEADVDCSGTIEATDALAILRFAAGFDDGLALCATPGG